jgi:hypothetical protein
MAMKPPKYLTPKGAGRAFWADVHAEFEIRDSHHLQLLAEACSCLDRITEARKQIEKDGAFVRDRFSQIKEHPGQKTIRDNQILLARLLRELQLDAEEPDNPRPPRLY